MTGNFNAYLAGFFGLVIFMFCGGSVIMDTSNISFLMAGDPAQHWIGWEFFRHTPLFQWPLGKNDAYGMGLDNSIVYTDSIPFLAVIFKLLSPVLPDYFQYTGLWLASCFILQGVLGYRLIFRFTESKTYSLIASLFYICSSAMMIRVLGHYALSAHWILLAGMLLYFDMNFRSKLWMALIVFSSSIHAYLMIMTLSIWMFCLLDRLLKDELSLKVLCLHITKTLVLLAITMYALGYFNVHGGTISDGFGFYKLNLNSLINPIFPVFSTIISPQATGGGDYEGLNYLGFGCIMLFLISVVYIPKSNLRANEIYSKNFIFFCLCLLLTIYALSPNISLGSSTIIHLRYPDALKGLTSTFRASGRFFWPVFYAIMTFAIVLNHKVFGKRFSISLLFLCCVVQVSDARHSFKEAKRVFSKSAAVSMPTGDIWDAIKHEKRNLIAVPPSDFNHEWIQWGYFSATNNLKMNFGYFARFDREAWNKQSALSIKSTKNGDLDINSVYLFKNKNEFESTIKKYKGEILTGDYNGSYILLPISPSR